MSVPAVNAQWRTMLGDHGRGIVVMAWRAFGPQGFSADIARGGDHGSLIVTQSDYPDEPVEWLHASIAWADRLPTYDELGLVHRAIFGRKRYAYQVFAPESAHVNIHPNALHLWGRVDGRPALPMAALIDEMGSV